EIAERLEAQRAAGAVGLDVQTAPPQPKQEFAPPPSMRPEAPQTERLPGAEPPLPATEALGAAAPNALPAAAALTEAAAMPAVQSFVAPAVAPPVPEITAGGAAIPGAARKRLKLRVLGDSRPVVQLIAGGTGITAVEPGPGGLIVVHYAGDDRFVADVVRHLVASGVGVVGVEAERNELERIFLEVTRGDLG
nr:ABC transporter ATP-binding protein [Polyangiaceae bacterium]